MTDISIAEVSVADNSTQKGDAEECDQMKHLGLG
jgi:hypothetical protein